MAIVPTGVVAIAAELAVGAVVRTELVSPLTKPE